MMIEGWDMVDLILNEGVTEPHEGGDKTLLARGRNPIRERKLYLFR